ncbi:MAG TPA: protease modulator HflC [Steroidobacteraceae bacterium]|nr:protease modulator HflC [Steroidobacteraceae bacterium]
MMTGRLVPIIVAAAIVVFAALSLFTVSETEYAIRTRFGAIENAAYGPGLHVKWPWEQVVKIDRRVLSVAHPMTTFLTSDDRALIVDYSIKWRVRSPTSYYEATGGDEASAGDRLSGIVENGIKGVVAGRTLGQVVASERPAVTDSMLESARRTASALGIELVDVRVVNLDLPDEIAAHVYEQMKEGFQKTANELRAQGDSAAKSIRAAADRQHTEIISNAQRDALALKGAADAQAAGIYARANASDPEFYAFYRSMQAYEQALGKSNGVLVLSPDSAFFKYMKDPGSARR